MHCYVNVGSFKAESLSSLMLTHYNRKIAQNHAQAQASYQCRSAAHMVIEGKLEMVVVVGVNSE